MNAGHDDGDQTADLNQREQARQHDRFQNAPRRHRAECDDDDHHDGSLGQIDELPDVAGRSDRDGGRGHYAGDDRQQTDRGGKRTGLERGPDIGGFTRADGIACRKFGIGGDGQRHDGGGDHERPRRENPGMPGDGADQDVDAGAHRNAGAVQHQQCQAEPPPQRDRAVGCGITRH